MVNPDDPQLPRIAWDNVRSVLRDAGVDSWWDGKVKMLVYDAGTMSWIAYTGSSGGGGDASAANQVTEIAKLTSIDGKLPALISSRVPVDGSGVTQPVSGTVAVSNFPATQTVVQTALSTGSISNNAAITTAASTFTAPANAIGFILEAESGNTDNIRWAVGSTATASVGMLAEPGRDTGYIPLAANISVIAISGTQAASVQWVIR